MLRNERFFLYGLVCLALTLALLGPGRAAALIGTPALASPSPSLAATQSPATLATCDLLAVTELLFASEAYAPARTDEEKRLTAKLAPLEAALDALQRELQTMTPADQGKPENQAKAADFQTKRDEYMQVRKDSSASYDRLVAGQFADAYERASTAAAAVAKEAGFTHVIAHKTGKIAGSDPQTLIADLLGRPMIVRPEGSDITPRVRTALKLPDTVSPATPNSADPANPPAK